jgi:hypothetical protein
VDGYKLSTGKEFAKQKDTGCPLPTNILAANTKSGGAILSVAEY